MKWHWLRLVESLTPTVLSLFPGTASLVPIVRVAIQTAEAIPGASSTDKLAHAQQLGVDGAAATNALEGRTVADPAVASRVAADAISTTVDTVNAVYAAHAPAPAPERR